MSEEKRDAYDLSDLNGYDDIDDIDSLKTDINLDTLNTDNAGYTNKNNNVNDKNMSVLNSFGKKQKYQKPKHNKIVYNSNDDLEQQIIQAEKDKQQKIKEQQEKKNKDKIKQEVFEYAEKKLKGEIVDETIEKDENIYINDDSPLPTTIEDTSNEESLNKIKEVKTISEDKVIVKDKDKDKDKDIDIDIDKDIDIFMEDDKKKLDKYREYPNEQEEIDIILPNEEEIKSIQKTEDMFKCMSEEEYLSKLSQEDKEQLYSVSVPERNVDSRNYISVENGKVVHSKEDNIGNIKKEIKRAKKETTKEIVKTTNTINIFLEDKNNRKKLLYVALGVFMLIFIGLYISLTTSLNKLDNQQTINDISTTNTQTQQQVQQPTNLQPNKEYSDMIEVVEQKVDINVLKENYLNSLRKLNAEELKTCMSYLDNKMNRITLIKKINEFKDKKVNDVITLEKSVIHFKTKEEFSIYEILHNSLLESVQISNDLLVLIDDGLTTAKLDSFVNSYEIYK